MKGCAYLQTRTRAVRCGGTGAPHRRFSFHQEGSLASLRRNLVQSQRHPRGAHHLCDFRARGNVCQLPEFLANVHGMGSRGQVLERAIIKSSAIVGGHDRC